MGPIAFKYCLLASLVFCLLFVLFSIYSKVPFNDNWRNSLEFIIISIIIIAGHQEFKHNLKRKLTYKNGLAIGILFIILILSVSCAFEFLYIKLVDPSLVNVVWERFIAAKQLKGEDMVKIDRSLSIAKKMFWLIYLVKEFLFTIPAAIIIPFFTLDRPKK